MPPFELNGGEDRLQMFLQMVFFSFRFSVVFSLLWRPQIKAFLRIRIKVGVPFQRKKSFLYIKEKCLESRPERKYRLWVEYSVLVWATGALRVTVTFSLSNTSCKGYVAHKKIPDDSQSKLGFSTYHAF